MHERADAAMERYASGDDSAFADVYDAVAPPVYRFALRCLGGDGARAEDVVQQTLLRMHRARGQFVSGAPVMPWAYTIARRLITDVVRRHRRERHLERIAAGEESSRDLGPHDLVVAAQTASRLRMAFEDLPPAQRVAFTLVRRDGLSLAAV